MQGSRIGCSVMMQIYLLSILYLLFGSGLLLVDYYGGRLLVLIRVRNATRTSLKTQILLIVSGLALVSVKIFWPVPPGPVLLGDLFPLLSMLVLIVYYLSQMVTYRRKGRDAVVEETLRFEQEMLSRTGSLIETHKRNLGFVVVSSAILHFLFPQAVLL